MRSLKFLVFFAFLSLAACFDSTTESQSATDSPSLTFRLWSPMNGLNNVVLQAARGEKGPIFRTIAGLQYLTSDGQFLMGSNTNPTEDLTSDDFDQAIYGNLFSSNRYWIDSQVSIHLEPTSSRVDFIWSHPSPPQSIWSSSLDFSLCPDLPSELFLAPVAANSNPGAGGSIIRVGRYVYLFSQMNGQKAQGVILLRRNTMMDTAHFPRAANESCGSFSETKSDLSSKWIDLDENSKNAFKTISAVPTASGIWLYYTSPLPSSANRLAFIDTLGTKTIVDSSSPGNPGKFIYFGLIGFQGRAWAWVNEGLVNLTSSSSKPSTTTPLFLSDVLKSKCAEISGKCVLYQRSQLQFLDFNDNAAVMLDNVGLQDAVITGVVQHQDTVYVSTLSGVFTKPVSRFFEPAK